MTRPVGDGHLKLGFSDGPGGSMDAIAFDAANRGLDALQSHQGRPVHLAGRVELNHWNGRSRVQLRLERCRLGRVTRPYPELRAGHERIPFDPPRAFS